ncbi:hypothetical protein HPB51_003545 [Rhipicephalus microplus]|uniref:Kinesin-like protein KIF2A-like N-terminal domain-containing protein n=1 Tax=Rhipicephalus microplus TaxID=6941 RepID=A0A9J6D8N5_RHIMP|nr:hypothetical protein HPB51_003545 [Rhipicephalus microplus]
MSVQLGGLRTGASVDIQRTDVCIHSAKLVSMNQDKQVIVAEWSEKGKTKGKELDFSTVVALNPGLQDVNRNQSKSFQSIRKCPCRRRSPLQIKTAGALLGRHCTTERSRPRHGAPTRTTSHNQDYEYNFLAGREGHASELGLDAAVPAAESFPGPGDAWRPRVGPECGQQAPR